MVVLVVYSHTLRRKVMVVVCHLAAAVIQRRCVIKDMGYNFVLFNSNATLYTMEGSFLPPGGWTLEPERVIWC